MHIAVPDSASEPGFVNSLVGTHTSRTMMLRELALLLDASAPDTEFLELRSLVIEDNITLKTTLSTRKKTFRHLFELYSLRCEVTLYRALRDLWLSNESERPLLAFLCAAARDPLLRATAPAVLDKPQGTMVTPQMLEEAVETAYPDHFHPDVRSRIGRNTASSWGQAGHLKGHASKIRSQAVSGPATTAYALLLGYLCGVRGTLLLDTFWARLLDCSATVLDAQAFAASQRGWLDYRSMGDVTDIRFSFLLRTADTRSPECPAQGAQGGEAK